MFVKITMSHAVEPVVKPQKKYVMSCSIQEGNASNYGGSIMQDYFLCSNFEIKMWQNIDLELAAKAYLNPKAPERIMLRSRHQENRSWALLFPFNNTIQ